MTPLCCDVDVAGSRKKYKERRSSSSGSGLALDRLGRVRADLLLVARGLAASRDRAQALIASSVVLVAGKPLTKPSQLVAIDAELELTAIDFPWVSRGALKLIGGLDAFNLIDPFGRHCLDLGASTGGFTEILLSRGAARVYAIDVGHNQLHPRLSSDPRVVVMDGVNARDLTTEMLLQASGLNVLPRLPDLIVCDASFISLVKVLPPALALAVPGAFLLALIKPQFEVGKNNVGKRGVVRDSALHMQTMLRIKKWLTKEMGWIHIGSVTSPIEGSEGNREFLIAASKPHN